jgi:hypothetical protein
MTNEADSDGSVVGGGRSAFSVFGVGTMGVEACPVEQAVSNVIINKKNKVLCFMVLFTI